MSMQKPLEALLRPPVEWLTTAATVLVGGLYWQCPDIVMIEKGGRIFAVALFLFGLVRFKQGLRVFLYQRNLKRMPMYRMTSAQLPVGHKKLFLGKGFLWETKHTQRLRDLDFPFNEHYKRPSSFYAWVRQQEEKWEKRPCLKYLAALTRRDHGLNPVRPCPPIGVEACIHGVSEKEQDIYLSLADRTGHIAVIGTTRVGKTRLAELLIGQDIRRGDMVVVLDPKGDAELLKRIYIEAKAAGRENDLIIFHLGFPEGSARYNAIGDFSKVTQVATRVTNGLPMSGNAAAFKEFAWRYVNLVAEALVDLGTKPTYQLINFYITKMDLLFLRYSEMFFAKQDAQFEQTIQRYIEKNTKQDKADPGQTKQPTRQQAIHEYVKKYVEQRHQENVASLCNELVIELYQTARLDKTYYDKITASVGPLLEKLTTGEVAGVLSPDYQDLDDPRAVFDWEQAIRQKRIVYIGMDAMTDTVVSSAVGNAMLADLVTVSGHIYKHKTGHGFASIFQEQEFPTVRLHADEFNEIIGDEFVPILNKSGGSGFSVTVYTQTWSDVTARLGSEAKAGQVAGNLNTIIMLRTKEEKTVDMLLKQLPTVPILRVLPASSSSDTPRGEDGIYYQTTNEDRFGYVDMRSVEQNDVLNLPKGQAFCLLEGGKLYKLRMPLPKEEDVDVPNSLAALVNKMHARRQTINKQRGSNE